MPRSSPLFTLSGSGVTAALVMAMALPLLPATMARAQSAPVLSHELVGVGQPICGEISSTGRDANWPGGEGWVDLRFNVQPDGQLTDVVAVRNNGNTGFVKKAVRFFSRCHFPELPKVNGKAVAMANVYMRHFFTKSPLRPSQGVQEKIELSRKLLAEARLDEAAASLGEADRSAHLIREQDEIIMPRSLLMGRRGQNDIALRYIQQIPVGESAVASDLWLAAVVRMRLRLEVKLGMLASAEVTARKVAKAEPQPEDAVTLAALEQLRQMGTSGQPMAVQGRVPAECQPVICDPSSPTWEYVMTHRTISLANTTGRLDTVTFRCIRKTVAVPATIGTTWTIPASLGTCAVEVTGEPGATFTLIDETING